MHIHYLKHVAFEGLGSMESIFIEQGCKLSRTCMYEDQSLPSIHDIDALIVMGGPMGVNDENDYPWLTLEKEFIESVIKRDIPVIGVCLGAQLIANVLGAQVTKNAHKEIGWFPVNQTEMFSDDRLNKLPDQFDALHWHSDTFEIPDGASNLFSSEACTNQGFTYGSATLGMQFHLEMLPSTVEAIYHECGSPKNTGTYVQSLEKMLMPIGNFQQAHKILKNLLEGFVFQKMPQ